MTRRTSDDATTRRRLLTAGGAVATGAIAGTAGCVGAQRDPNYSPPTDASQEGGQAGGGQETAGGGGGPSRTPSATVNMVTTADGDQIFDPDVVWLEPGGTVTWVNQSGTHSTTAYAEANDKPTRIPEGGQAWDSGILTDQGAEFAHTFETGGVYDYFCIPHEALGMVGTIVVGRPSPEGQPGLAPPQDSLPDGAATAIERLNGVVREQL